MKKIIAIILVFGLLVSFPLTARAEENPSSMVSEFVLEKRIEEDGYEVTVPELSGLDLAELSDLNEKFVALGEACLKDQKRAAEDKENFVLPSFKYTVTVTDELLSLYWKSVGYNADDEFESFDGSVVIDLDYEEVLTEEELFERYGINNNIETLLFSTIEAGFRPLELYFPIYELDANIALSYLEAERRFREGKLHFSVSPDNCLLMHIPLVIEGDGVPELLPLVLEPEPAQVGEADNPLYMKFKNTYELDEAEAYVLHLGTMDFSSEDAIINQCFLIGSATKDFGEPSPGLIYRLDNEVLFGGELNQALEGMERYLFVPKTRRAVLRFSGMEDEIRHVQSFATSYGNTLVLFNKESFENHSLELICDGESFDYTPVFKNKNWVWPADIIDLTDSFTLLEDEVGFCERFYEFASGNSLPH